MKFSKCTRKQNLAKIGADGEKRVTMVVNLKYKNISKQKEYIWFWKYLKLLKADEKQDLVLVYKNIDKL